MPEVYNDDKEFITIRRSALLNAKTRKIIQKKNICTQKLINIKNY
jgi:hypothetical protein